MLYAIYTRTKKYKKLAIAMFLLESDAMFFLNALPNSSKYWIENLSEENSYV